MVEHHEVCIILRFPIPFHLLYLFKVLEDALESTTRVEDFVSAVISDVIAGRALDWDMVEKTYLKLSESGIEYEPELVQAGLVFIHQFIKAEITEQLPRVNMKRFQCVSLSNPFSIFVNFFTDGQEHHQWRRTL